jgi:hypothetical protein
MVRRLSDNLSTLSTSLSRSHFEARVTADLGQREPMERPLRHGFPSSWLIVNGIIEVE